MTEPECRSTLEILGLRVVVYERVQRSSVSTRHEDAGRAIRVLEPNRHDGDPREHDHRNSSGNDSTTADDHAIILSIGGSAGSGVTMKDMSQVVDSLDAARGAVAPLRVA